MMPRDKTLDVSADVVDAHWRALLEAIYTLPKTTTVEEIMAVICRGARAVSNADGITFVRRDGDLCYYADEDAISALWKGKRFPMSACISGWCMLNRQTAVIRNIYQDPRIPHDAYRSTFVRTLVMVPVRPSSPIAAIGSYWAMEHDPSAHAITMLEALAQSATTAILKTESFEALQ